ncbi:YihY/virulence factor BrkB family protein [Parasedimentitalea psychrophila]|uniref:YihY/virulence factor BrkB family protein n=2 Tax=Parasedimentitalea psychrophila TaxID=2997337 RepID=A0A9Y2L4T8_9RHOB|nr:YihY/virulence factor BrkB family protein [Parasedimentitalea psychrophila]
MLALFPFTIFALSLGRAVSDGVSTQDIVEFVYGTWPDSIAAPIVNEVQAVLRDSSLKTLTIGGLLAVFFASNGVDAVRQTLTDAYREHDPRPLWKSRAVCVLFVLCGAAILTFSAALVFAVPVYIEAVYGRSEMTEDGALSYEALRHAVSFILLIFSVLACHLWLPGHSHSLKQVLPGVVLTVVLWITSGGIFAQYVSNFSAYSITYAGLAGVMTALVFLYVMAAIFVIGAEFNGRLIAGQDAGTGTGD